VVPATGGVHIVGTVPNHPEPYEHILNAPDDELYF
jgi:hypothetical protein